EVVRVEELASGRRRRPAERDAPVRRVVGLPAWRAEAGIEPAQAFHALQLARDALERGDLAVEALRVELAALVDELHHLPPEALGPRAGQELRHLVGLAAPERARRALRVGAAAERAPARGRAADHDPGGALVQVDV